MLIKHLPRDSALNRELHGEAAEWTVTDHLLAAAVDHLAAANWMFACVNSAEEGDQPDPPVPVPRPGDDARTEEYAVSPREQESGADRDGGPTAAPSPAQLARFFG
ncbi:hypothetical protein [Streptomyces spinoverrucosus]|uniref:hypothetical protein n=1 Tax=Streptomyces spinoverrucosus TaxID=284043 RepID=UPI0027DA7D79|nr:hypothetical protein [Streptomyces spinoverrucosus]